MFANVSNSSKYGFITLVLFLKEKGFKFVDCQQETEHLESLGAKAIGREEFYTELNSALSDTSYCGNWSEIFPDFETFNPTDKI